MWMTKNNYVGTIGEIVTWKLCIIIIDSKRRYCMLRVNHISHSLYKKNMLENDFVYNILYIEVCFSSHIQWKQYVHNMYGVQ
jgi:hypothetical protein